MSRKVPVCRQIGLKSTKFLKELYCQRNHKLGVKQAFEFQNKFWASKFSCRHELSENRQPSVEAFFLSPVLEVVMEVKKNLEKSL